MRLFVFAIGGTGSRVLTSLVFQLAAGAKPKDADGNELKNLSSIVPIIIDPHEGNDGLNKLKELLYDYREIRKKIYGKTEDGNGFFATRIETLKELAPSKVKSDSFFFGMKKVSESDFASFIGHHQVDADDANMIEMLFSKEELATTMSEGFYGSPNIGCVALNEFVKSSDFEAFKQAFSYDEDPQKSDKIFVIGSIFGGTGAAGLPLIISSIRNLQSSTSSNESGNDAVAKAPIGALVVMPYFSIDFKKDSAVNDIDFITKTKSALRYYDTSLNQYINRIYYISDPQGTNGFENDPGTSKQAKNKAHIVEYIGATAIFDFLGQNDLGVDIIDDKVFASGDSRSRGRLFSFERDENQVTFNVLPKSTNSLLLLPMMKFFIMRHFMERHLKNYMDKPFAKKHEPILQDSLYKNNQLKDFFTKFDSFFEEIKDHGSKAHNLDLFVSPNGDDYSNCFTGLTCKKGGVFKVAKKIKAEDIKESLNKAADGETKKETQEARWYAIADKALSELIAETFDYKNLID